MGSDDTRASLQRSLMKKNGILLLLSWTMGESKRPPPKILKIEMEKVEDNIFNLIPDNYPYHNHICHFFHTLYMPFTSSYTVQLPAILYRCVVTHKLRGKFHIVSTKECPFLSYHQNGCLRQPKTLKKKHSNWRNLKKKIKKLVPWIKRKRNPG